MSFISEHIMKKLLFITKNYPPAIGGMENYCRDVVKYFRKSWIEVILIANGKWIKWLPFFAVKTFFLWLWYSFKVDAIWVGDGSISLFGLLFSKVTNTPWYVTVHGLDITRTKPLYQKLIPKIIWQANHIVAVSSNTKNECIKRWLPKESITIIPNGVDPELMPLVSITKNVLLSKHNLPLWKKVLFSIWRHVERKGFHWFIEEVLPKLSDEYIYVLAWSWALTSKYDNIIKKNWLNNVYLVWRISDEDKFAFYSHSYRFIMPNIEVEWDIEWFGIVCIEAWWYWLPVIANNVDGISDAVIESKTWNLIDNNNEWSSLIEIEYISDLVKTNTIKNYDWNDLIKKYIFIIFWKHEKVIN